jgi:anti-sigma factor RsiW
MWTMSGVPFTEELQRGLPGQPTCASFRDQLSAYAALSAAERPELEAHLRDCVACRAEYAALEAAAHPFTAPANSRPARESDNLLVLTRRQWKWARWSRTEGSKPGRELTSDDIELGRDVDALSLRPVDQAAVASLERDEGGRDGTAGPLSFTLLLPGGIASVQVTVTPIQQKPLRRQVWRVVCSRGRSKVRVINVGLGSETKVTTGMRPLPVVFDVPPAIGDCYWLHFDWEESGRGWVQSPPIRLPLLAESQV